MARINVKYQSGSRSGTTEVFSTSHYQTLYLGRDPSCDIRFDLDNDDLVSRSHAMIEWDLENQQRFVITDLLSSNGTFVNGERITDATEIHSGDRINLGQQGPGVEISIERPKHTNGSTMSTLSSINLKPLEYKVRCLTIQSGHGRC